MNSASSTVSPKPPLAELSELKLSGVVSGGTDIVMLATANGDVQALAQDSTLNLAQGWTGSEFNLVGDCCGAGAYFLNPATSLTVRLTALNGTTNPPTYTMFFSGATGEFNNLTLGSAPSVVGGTSPAIVFQESGGGSRPDGVILGDPHLNNIYGVHYDFQGTGDFLMLRADPDLEVQARLAPWVDPRASVTTALGVRMGETHVAVCLNGLEVNGVPTSVDDGKQLKLDDGVVVTRQNNTYVISRITGDQVQAKLQGRWMDITTKLGAAHPLRVGGLLGGDSDLRLLMQDGSALTQPISWNTWKSYGDSWRVADADSLLCHGSAVPPGFPEKRVTFEDLSGPEREHASAVCERAKVPHGPLFYDCVLDVALTKQDSAANAFANHPPVKTVISPLPPP
jgi:hypothetical protein